MEAIQGRGDFSFDGWLRLVPLDLRRLRGFAENEEKKDFVVKALNKATKIHCRDEKRNCLALELAFGIKRGPLVHKKDNKADSTFYCKTAVGLGLRFCQAHRVTPLVIDDDIDESVIWHLGLKFELLRKSI